MSSCDSSEIQRQFAGIVQGLGQSVRSTNRSSSSPPMASQYPMSPALFAGPAPAVFPNPTSSNMALSAVQPRSSSMPPAAVGQAGFYSSRQASLNPVVGSAAHSLGPLSPRATLVETSSRSASPMRDRGTADLPAWRVNSGGGPQVQTISQPPHQPMYASSPQPQLRSYPQQVFTEPLGSGMDFTFQPLLPEGPPVYTQHFDDQQREVPRIQQYANIQEARPAAPTTPMYARPLAKTAVVYGKQLDVMEMFPALFTAFCFAVYITPIILSYHIGCDPQVIFWIGDYISWVIYLPVVYVWAHIYHTVYRLPSKMVMVVCLIGSCVVLLVLSDRVLLAAYDRANEFAARDCDTFPTKRALQREWESAHAYYATCIASVAEERGLSNEAAYDALRIRDCPDYETMLVEHPHWEYLGQLEEEQQCSGWCERAQPLWFGGEVRDSCSSVVADVMLNKIQWTMLQVVVYTISVLAIVSVLLVTVGPALWHYAAERQAACAQ